MEELALMAHHALMDAVTVVVVAVLNCQVQAVRAVKAGEGRPWEWSEFGGVCDVKRVDGGTGGPGGILLPPGTISQILRG